MGRIGTFVLGAAVGGAAVYGSLQYHVVRADDGLHFIRKTNVTFSGVYVDIREFGPQDWLEHPDLAEAVMRSGKRELVHGAAVDTVNESLRKLLGPLEE